MVNWFCIKYIKASGGIGCDYRQFENWEDAERFGELRYGLDLWNITQKTI
jgi:hypothetical protein